MADPKTYTEEEYNAMIAERDALKANRDEILREAKKAKDALKNYDGVDPTEYKALKDAAAEADRKKAAAEGNFDVLKKQLIDAHGAEKAGLESKIGKYQKALERRLVEAELTQSLVKAGAKKTMLDLLVLRGREFVKVKETDDGFEQFVADAGGNPRIADGKGTPMSIDDLVLNDLKAKYPDAFDGTGSSGGGASKSAAGGGGGNPQVIASTNSPEFLANLPSVAKGSTKVGSA